MKITRLQKIIAAALGGLLVVAITAATARCPGRDDDATARGISTAPLPPGSPILNVKAFGAKGDDSTDDRVAVLAAITAGAALTGGAFEVYFPPGTYVVSRSGSSAFSIDLPAGNVLLAGVPGKSVIRHPTGMPNASVAVIRIDSKSDVVIRDLVIDGYWQNAATTIAAASDATTLPQSTINVLDASYFPSGSFGAVLTTTAGVEYIACTGKSATTLTGCSGGTGTLYTGQRIGYSDSHAGLNHITQTSRSTTIAAGSDGQVLPQATINVASTSSFSGFSSGDIIRVSTNLGFQDVTCTATSGGNSFTGCTGGTGTMSTGGEVFNGADPQNFGIMIRGAKRVTIQDVKIRRTYGDCIWVGASSITGLSTEDLRVHNVDCDIAARDGLAFGGSATRVVIDSSRFTNIFAGPLDSEPVTGFVRDVVVENSFFDSWFVPENRSGYSMALSGGRIDTAFTQAGALRNFRVRNNVFMGPFVMQRAHDVVIEANRFIQNYARDASASLVQFVCEDIRIRNNYFYTRALSDSNEGGVKLAALQILTTQSGSTHYSPTNVSVENNTFHVRNGRYAVWLKSPGGLATNATGTATGVTSTTMTNALASWTTNQWQGLYVRIGSAVAGIASNTDTVLTLEPATGGAGPRWVSPQGEQNVGTPSPGTYVILRNTGVVDVVGNVVDGTSDGYGAGKGIRVTNGSNNAVDARVRIRSNIIRNTDTDAITVKFDGTDNFQHIEITDNFAHDDQPTHTLTNLVKFTNSPKANKLIMRGNVLGEGVTNQTSGLSTGRWLVNDGICPEWAGYGSPESAVTAPICARYSRVDGGTTTSQYFKESGVGSTGWIAK